MISMLRGIVAHIQAELITLDVQGVGYEVIASSGCLNEATIGATMQFVIYTDVQENSIRLFGFIDHLEKQVFLLLTRVKGLGARSASHVISKIDKLDLLRIIAAGDATKLQKVKGIGKKTSERIVVELKDKVGEYIISRPEGEHEELRESDAFGEALQALMALGFARKDAERAVQHVSSRNIGHPDAAVVVKEALRVI